jgi:hypothetical protein
MQQNKWDFVAGSSYPIPDPTTLNVHVALMRIEAIACATRKNNDYQGQ